MTFDENIVSAAQLIEAVEKSGYGASVASNETKAPKKDAVKQQAEMQKKEIAAQKHRLIVSGVFTVLLFYVCMGHMFSWPLPGFLLGDRNLFTLALTQFFLAAADSLSEFPLLPKRVYPSVPAGTEYGFADRPWVGSRDSLRFGPAVPAGIRDCRRQFPRRAHHRNGFVF